jgi:predicted Zn-dependent peptidase
MIKTIELQPGVTLRCFGDSRFKQGCLSLQLVRPMCRQEAALNALIPAVLLRGTVTAPDLRAITTRLDDLYGAAVGPVVRRVGDYQTTGLVCGFISDRYALPGDRVLEPAIEFLGQLLLEPVTEKGSFRADYVKGEKTNLIAAIEAQRNDKRAYASSQMLRKMCKKDSFGIPRLGEAAQVRRITAKAAWEHYQKILRESRMDIFYVGQAEPETVAKALKPLLDRLERNYVNLPEQTAYQPCRKGSYTETMEVSQGKLCMGFMTPITIRDREFAAMQVCNVLFGGGMTSLLFMNIREKLSLCYDIGSGYHSAKGIVAVSAGIDCDKYDTVKEQVLQQLRICQKGEFTQEQLDAAKQAVISSLQGVHDSPGSIESYYATSALSGLNMDPAQYKAAVEQVTAAQVTAAAQTLQLHTDYFLKGVQ